MSRRFIWISVLAAMLGFSGVALAQADTSPSQITTQQGDSNGDCMQFVSDDNIPDGSKLDQGSSQTKSWLIRNCGTTDWKGYSLDLTFVNGGGNSWSTANPLPEGQNKHKNPSYYTFTTDVEHGEEIHIPVSFTVPAPGNYLVQFEMRIPQTNHRFGDILTIVFTSK